MSPSENEPLTDINSADPEALVLLPGVGSEMAKRIIAGRPYHSFEELLQIEGLGVRTLDRILPMINLESALPQTETKGSIGESAREDQDIAEDKPTFLDRLEKFAQSLIDRFQISSQILGFVLISGAISVILSVILTLVILAGINRTLNIGRHSTVQEMRSEMSQLDGALTALSVDLASVDQRLQAVEGLSGRMATLESEFDLIKEDMDQAVGIVKQISENVTSITEEVDSMAEKVSLFDGFVKGLRLLVSDLFPPAETTTSP